MKKVTSITKFRFLICDTAIYIICFACVLGLFYKILQLRQCLSGAATWSLMKISPLLHWLYSPKERNWLKQQNVLWWVYFGCYILNSKERIKHSIKECNTLPEHSFFLSVEILKNTQKATLFVSTRVWESFFLERNQKHSFWTKI